MHAGADAGLVQPLAYVQRPIPSAPAEHLLIQDVVLHHLSTPGDIKEILELRDEIDLSAHTAAGRQQFERLEKKETSAGSSSDSNSAGSGSGRSASSRWVIN